MYYQRAKKIEDRFKKMVDLLAREGATMNEITKELGVSAATFFRMVAELRRRNFRIRLVREGSESRYQLVYVIDRTTNKVISHL